MTEPKYLSTAQAGTRLRVDASTVGKYIRHGLVVRRATAHRRETRIKLAASRMTKGSRLQWGIRPAAVREFNARRGAR